MLPDGSRVKLHMIQQTEEGRVFVDTHTRGGVPEEIIIGEEMVFPALEESIRSMLPGDTRTLQFSAVQAYGERDESFKELIPKADFPRADRLPFGQYIIINLPSGEERALVTEVDDDHILLDFNQELAGHDITCNIEIIDVLEEESDLKKREEYFYGNGDGCCCHHH